MRKFNYIITDHLGIHARPAGLLVKEAGKFTSKIMISKDGKEADVKRIFGVMGLGVKQGDEIEITVDGEDEAAAFTVLETFFKEHL